MNKTISKQLRIPLKKEDVLFFRRKNAKRYIARVDDKGQIVVTVPRGGSQREAFAFAQSHGDWLNEQRDATLKRLQESSLKSGDRIWYRGERVELKVSKDWGRPMLAFGDQKIFIADEGMNLARPLAECLRRLATEEFPVLARKLARRFGVAFEKVGIRDQKTRWGSCSSEGSMTLNWRLVMTPPEAAEYIIIHELMHLKEMNHSPAFWALVEKACPNYEEHERWLDRYQGELCWGRGEV